MKLGYPTILSGTLLGDGAASKTDESCRPTSSGVTYMLFGISTVNVNDTNTPKARVVMKLATGPVYLGLGPTYTCQAGASDPEDQQSIIGGDADAGCQLPGPLLVSRECYPIVVIGTDATKIANTKTRKVFYHVRRVLEQ